MEIIGLILAFWTVFGLLGAAIISLEFSYRPDEDTSYFKFLFLLIGGPLIWMATFIQYLFDKRHP